jgi:hypothetical protein
VSADGTFDLSRQRLKLGPVSRLNLAVVEERLGQPFAERDRFCKSCWPEARP